MNRQRELWNQKRELERTLNWDWETLKRYFEQMHGVTIKDSKWNMLLVQFAKIERRLTRLERDRQKDEFDEYT